MSNQPQESSAAIVSLEQAGRMGMIVLQPVVSIMGEEDAQRAASSPYLIESIAAVKIRPELGQTYNHPIYAPAEKGVHALSGLGLAAIAAAAGIKWVPELTGPTARERRPDGHVYIRFRAAGAIRQPNGEWHIELAEKEIDTADEAEELERAYLAKIEKGRAKFTPKDVPAMVEREIFALRKHILSHAETKAKNRVIRRILGLPQTFSTQELSRPFAVPRLLYRPDLADPLALERVQVEGQGAAEALFGAALPAPPELSGPEEEEGAEVSEGEPTEQPGNAGEQEPEPSQPDEAGKEEPASPAAEQGKAPEEGAGSSDLPEPKEDPVIDGGPHAGKRFSEVAETHPDYLRAIAHESKVARKRALAQAWLDYFQPGLGGEAS